MYTKLTVLLLFLSAFSHANTLIVPAQFEVLKVDGRNYDSSFFAQRQKIKLINGKHVALLKYKELFDDPENDDHTTVKSEPFIVLFSMQGSPLELVFKVNKDEKEARSFAESPLVRIVDTRGNEVSSKTMLLADYEQKLFQVALLTQSQESGNSVESHSNIYGKVRPPINEHSNSRENSTSAPSVVAPREAAPVLEMLLYWWEQANEQQKKAFLSQLNLIKE
jgi:uncharacterized protein